MTILDEIFAHKYQEVANARDAQPLSSLERIVSQQPPPPDMLAALRRTPQPAVIAEIKRRSPSKGLLIKDFDPLHLAGIYNANGAAAISVLTDEYYFGGHIDHLQKVALAFPQIPLLRKDFICDEHQVYQARAAGAASVLLIVAGLPLPRLRSLHELILALNMQPLVEVHNIYELEQALEIGAQLLGINNRNLHTFQTTLDVTFELVRRIPDDVLTVSESGIQTPLDVQRLAHAGVDAILVGEALVTAADIAAQLRSLAQIGEQT